LSDILSNSSGGPLQVALVAHYVAHEGVVTDKGADARSLSVNQHRLEEHLIFGVVGASGIHIHTCVDYIVEDIDTRGGVEDQNLLVRNVRIGTRVVSSAQEVCSAVEEKGELGSSAFAWFVVDQPLVKTNRAEFREAMDVI
ncbi:MAG: hypothetical protein PV344_04265, partial [Anaplasma sp.]|nr:hypothetical protein [Anaplasma sp.]